MEDSSYSPHMQIKDFMFTKLPQLFSPSHSHRTQSLHKKTESRYILSNSVDESILSNPSRISQHSKKPRLLRSLYEVPMSNEINIALKNILTLNKPKVVHPPKKKLTMTSNFFMKNVSDQEINGFIRAIFSHEPSVFRKVGLTSEPEALDLRAAEKILQDAKKIIKHGVTKKSIQHEHVTQVEEFWRNQISREQTVRWDLFEEGFLVYLETFMVCNYGSLRKLNWKLLLGRLCNKLADEVEDHSLWPVSPLNNKQRKQGVKVITYNRFAAFVTNGEMNKIMGNCIQELPFYIENLRKGNLFYYSCGCFYKGEWKDGRKEGNGVLEFCSGENYAGSFIRGLREDYGTFSGDGYLYKGNFRKDKFNGYGRLKYPDSGVYEGLWMKSLFTHGKFEFGDGSVYIGEWNNGCFEGKGKLITGDGTRKKGMWRNGRLCGEGSIKYTDASHVKGFFVDDILQNENSEEEES